MNCREIQRAIIFDRYRRSMVMPNYTPMNWYESDIYEVLPSNLTREYEIKISRSDFFADAAKTVREWVDDHSVTKNKHAQLAARDIAGPSQFWFVTPVGLVLPSEVPTWAGLIYANPSKSQFMPVRLSVEKKAERLHNTKVSDEMKNRLHVTGYYRMHALLIKRHELPTDYSDVEMLSEININKFVDLPTADA